MKLKYTSLMVLEGHNNNIQKELIDRYIKSEEDRIERVLNGKPTG